MNDPKKEPERLSYETMFRYVNVDEMARFSFADLQAATDRVGRDMVEWSDAMRMCVIQFPLLPQDAVQEVIKAAAKHTPGTALEVFKDFLHAPIVAGAYRFGEKKGYRGNQLLRGMERALRHRLGILGGACDRTMVVQDVEPPRATYTVYDEAAPMDGERLSALEHHFREAGFRVARKGATDGVIQTGPLPADEGD